MPWSYLFLDSPADTEYAINEAIVKLASTCIGPITTESKNKGLVAYARSANVGSLYIVIADSAHDFTTHSLFRIESQARTRGGHIHTTDLCSA